MRDHGVVSCRRLRGHTFAEVSRTLREIETEGLILCERREPDCLLSRRYDFTESDQACLKFLANSPRQYGEEIWRFFLVYEGPSLHGISPGVRQPLKVLSVPYIVETRHPRKGKPVARRGATVLFREEHEEKVAGLPKGDVIHPN